MKLKNWLALIFALSALAVVLTAPLGKKYSQIDDWANSMPWMDQGIVVLALLSIAASIWTWRDSVSARIAPLILAMSWVIAALFSYP